MTKPIVTAETKPATTVVCYDRFNPSVPTSDASLAAYAMKVADPDKVTVGGFDTLTNCLWYIPGTVTFDD